MHKNKKQQEGDIWKIIALLTHALTLSLVGSIVYVLLNPEIVITYGGH
jgi:hypothetical protein